MTPLDLCAVGLNIGAIAGAAALGLVGVSALLLACGCLFRALRYFTDEWRNLK